MWNFAITAAVFVGTSLQMLLAVADAREAHKDALAWARAEDDLINEQPRLRRRKTRRELATWRDPDTDRSLAYMDVAVASWTFLVWASGAGMVVSLLRPS